MLLLSRNNSYVEEFHPVLIASYDVSVRHIDTRTGIVRHVTSTDILPV